MFWARKSRRVSDGVFSHMAHDTGVCKVTPEGRHGAGWTVVLKTGGYLFSALLDLSFWHVTTKTWAYSWDFGFFFNRKKKPYQEMYF